MQKVSCIIPAYNEVKNIGAVLKAVKDSEYLDEIIVVDDGSKDDTVFVVEGYKKKCKKLRLLKNKVNQGKTQTIVNGVKASKYDLIVILDSDLINLQDKNIKALVTAIEKKKYDMAILDRAGDRTAVWGWTGCARFFGGERIFWKKDFLKLKFPKHANFLLEVIMNLDYMNKNKRITTIYCANLYTVHDFKKRGYLAGLKHYFEMGKKIIQRATVKGFLKQGLKIEDNRISALYYLYNLPYMKWPMAIIIGAVSLLLGTFNFIHLNAKNLRINQRLYNYGSHMKTAILQKRAW